MSAARSKSLRARAREDGRGEAATRAGRLAAFLQPAAGVLRRQAFLAAAAHCRGLPDASAAWFRQFAAATRVKDTKKGFPANELKIAVFAPLHFSSSDLSFEEIDRLTIKETLLRLFIGESKRLSGL